MSLRSAVGNALFLLFLLAASLRDLKNRQVELWILLSGMAAGLFFPVDPGLFLSLRERIPAVFPGLLLLLVRKAGASVGEADGLALIACGLFLGIFREIGLLLAASLLCAGTGGVIFLRGIFRGENLRKRKIPFLPFLLAAWTAALMMEAV
jgi:leader peptidase (prepilin peptidase)/N-methyltransferase